MEEDRFSVHLHGDLRYAESREVATLRNPSMEMEERERAELEADVVAKQLALQAAMGRGDQAKIDEAEDRYDAAVRALMAYEEEDAPVTPVMAGGGEYLSLGEAMRCDPWSARQLDAAEMQARLDAWEMLCRFVFQDGFANPWRAFKNFLALVRRASPGHLREISQTELAMLCHETKASPSAREKKMVEGLMRKFKMLGYHLLGGTKSDETRRRCAAAQMGNTNRRKAKGGKKGGAKKRPDWETIDREEIERGREMRKAQISKMEIGN